MNFIGHATVALWHRREPRFVLGSMLPDFAGMVRARLVRDLVEAGAGAGAGAGARNDVQARASAGERSEVEVEQTEHEPSDHHARAPSAGGARGRGRAPQDASLAAGVALHHRTDEAFHAAPLFTALMQEVLDGLCERGVPRGTARAVGHIGVELLIDGELVRTAEVAEAYAAALHAGADLGHAFVDPDGGSRWERLRAALLAHGAPHDYRDPETVLRRLTQVLARRPRLAIDPSAAQIVGETLPAVQRRVVAHLPALLASVRAALF